MNLFHSNEFWLKTVRKCNHNTTIKYIANFRKVVNRCVKCGWLEKILFVGFKTTKKEVIAVFLTEHELNRIAQTQFSSERLTQVQIIFFSPVIREDQDES